jgi:hypothetical protein
VPRGAGPQCLGQAVDCPPQLDRLAGEELAEFVADQDGIQLTTGGKVHERVHGPDPP